MWGDLQLNNNTNYINLSRIALLSTYFCIDSLNWLLKMNSAWLAQSHESDNNGTAQPEQLLFHRGRGYNTSTRDNQSTNIIEREAMDYGSSYHGDDCGGPPLPYPSLWPSMSIPDI